MDIRKVLAGSLAALTSGATLLMGAFAVEMCSTESGLGTYVCSDNGRLSSPTLVVGDAVDSTDTIAAADLAAAAAGFATTETTVQGTAVTVTGGTALDTANTKIYLGDGFGKAGLRGTVTKVNEPTLLASAVLTDKGSTSYNYDQYINLGTGALPAISFGNSGGDLGDPILMIDTGSNISSPVLNYTVVLNKQLNLGSTNVHGTTIKLLGTDYTIAATSNFVAGTYRLVLFGSSNLELLTTGEEKTINVAGRAHTVKLLGVSDADTAVVSIDGEARSVDQGKSYTVSGVDLYVDSVFFYGSFAGAGNQAKVSFGTAKLTLDNGTSVKRGANDDTVDGTLVALIGNTSKLTIAMTAKDSSSDFIRSGSTWTDPVFGKIKVHFGGASGGTSDMITIDNSGTTAASLKFADYTGNEKTLTWAYTGTTTFSPGLNASSTRAYHVVENETVARNDYIVLSPSPTSEFGHILQYTSASSIGSSGAYIELKDVMSDATNRISLTSEGNTAADFYIDGQEYHVKITNTGTQTAVFTWGAGSGIGTAGSATTVFPLVKAKGGEWITLATNATTADGVTYELPTNTTFAKAAAHNGTIQTFGRVSYAISSTGVLQLSQGGVNMTAPTVLIIEEEGKDTTETNVKDAVMVTIADGSGTGVDVTIQQPRLTAATTSGYVTLQSDNSVSVNGDRYGTFVRHDTDGQGLVDITYPNDQATAWVAVGTDPKFSTSTTGGTVRTAVKITQPVAKFASEVDSSALTGDLILVGGPCANSLVATLMEPEGVTCGNWAFTTGVIKEYANAFGSGKKALVVAGTLASDTRSLAGRVMSGTLSFSS